MSLSNSQSFGLHRYREDIDGLRAIAVLSVVIFHLNASWLSGGFLGVDIFFVISGYLITSILYRDIRSSNFSFTSFYTRRIKRILPVFFVTLLVGMFLVYSSWEFDDARLMGRSAMSAIVFASNLLFGLTGNYFDPNMEEFVFLHLWSLSVEEQFYFVFPLLLILLMMWQKVRSHLVTILIVLGVLLLLSSFFSDELGLRATSIYYMPHLRFGEMLVGSVFAISVANGNVISDKILRVLQPLSVLLLLASLFLGSYFTAPLFPGILALVPCVATAIVLHPSAEPSPLAKFLSWSPLVWIGKISYSLYLWHWIVLAYFRYFLDSLQPLSLQLCAVSVVLMFALSAVTYYWVEQPIRKMDLSFKQSFLYGYLLPSLLCVGLFFSFDYVIPRPQWEHSLLARQVVEDGDQDVQFGVIRGDRSKEVANVLVAGDSHTMHLTGFIDQMGKHEGWKAFVSDRPGSQFFIKGIGRVDRGTERDVLDLQRNQYLVEHLNEFDVVILAAYWDYPQSDYYMEALEETLTYLENQGKEVIILHSMYQIGRLIRRDVYSPNISRFVHVLGGYEYPINHFEQNNRGQAERVKRFVAEKFPTIRWIDLAPLLPSSGIVDGKFLYPDKDHINHFASEWLAKEFIKSGGYLVSQTSH